MQRREFITLLGGTAAACPVMAKAQQAAIPVIGLLSSLSPKPVARQVEAFLQTLKEAGYTEGKTVAIEYRWAEGDYGRLPELAADLVNRNVTVVIAVGGDPAALAAKRATTAIPIVFMVGRNPISFGLVASLNRPGGNATGVNFFISETEAKRMELLRELIPSARSLAVLMNPKTEDAHTQLPDFEAAANAFQMRMQVANASNEGELEAAFTVITQTKVDALLVAGDPFLNNKRNLIVSLAEKNAIPAVYPLRDFAEAGGLISYGASLTDAYRQVGVYVVKILQGMKPTELPVVQPTKLELVINLKTARALGITVPPTLLARADEVIE